MKTNRATNLLYNVVLTLFMFFLLTGGAFALASDPDLNDDGIVDIFDISLVGSCFGLDPQTTPQCEVADTDGDGDIDFDDLIFVNSSFGQSGFPTGEGDDTTPPSIEITSPAKLSLFNSSAVTVSGTVDDELASVFVNGIEATLTPGNSATFTAEIVLKEGNNVITATAQDAVGNTSTASIQVTLDTDPPTVTVETPKNGAILGTLKTNVAGQINDIITGTTINADDCQVSVNGVEASVVNRSFVVPDLPLKPGPNTLNVIAQDAAGNQSSTSVQVTVQNLAGQKIIATSGDNQSGVIQTQLPNSLVATVFDADQNPIAGRLVVFKVVRGDGLVSNGTTEANTVSIMTDNNGQASALYTLGSRIGTGSHRVEATALGFVGQAEFRATATNSPPIRITTTAGNNQVGVAGEPLPKPFVVLVTDSGGNPVSNVEVTFSITQGGGNIDGQSTIIRTTDLDGTTGGILTLGSQEGISNNGISATFSGLKQPPAIITASGRVAGLAEDTTVSGIVLDNQDIPVPGVTIHLEVPGVQLDPVPTAIVDEQGQFTITNAPVGTIRLIVDGTTTTRPGKWPLLEFDLTTIPGQDNTVGMPIHILQLADNEIVMPNGGPTQDITLQIPGVPGTKLTIFANSVTCPNNQSQCQISWTQVNGERVPMPPPLGSTFALAWTIQPAGAHFSPPVAICIPNMDFPSGHQTEMFSFDHDLGEFVAIGTATVTADGSQLCSDPGFGIVKAGWGGCVDPPDDETCVDGCAVCKSCDTNTGSCVNDNNDDPGTCKKCSGGEHCRQRF